jgi:tetratricopeptide (TPR) repeat protein
MSLFGALSELVCGAALASAPACDLALQDATVEDRQGFATWIVSRPEMREVRAAVEAIGRDIWIGAETRGLAQIDLDEHVRASARIISEFRPSAGLLAEIASAARAQSPTGSSGAEPIAGRISNEMLARVRSSGGLDSLAETIPLREEVILFLLDRTFAHLVDADLRLIRLGPVIAEFAGEHQSTDDARDAGTTSGLAAMGISRTFVQQIEMAGGQSFLADLGMRYGLSDRAMRRLVALVDAPTTTADARVSRLESMASWLADVRAQLMRPANDDAEARRMKAAAASALAEGEFEAAVDALRNVRRELREARRKTEERLQDEALALKAQMLEEAKATARLAELLAVRGEHAQAADLFAEAAMALPRTEREIAWTFNLQRSEALLRHARERGDATALAEALNSYSNLVRAAAETTNTKSLAEACLGYGDALFFSSERDPNSGRLRDSITIYQRACQLLERDRHHAGLIRARLALARAMARQGERDGSIETLRQAAEAFREAVNAIDSNKLPFDHAAAQISLGDVLLAIEEREGGTAPLAEAAGAYRAAIGLLDRETSSEQWGEAQMNLALALLGLGEQDGTPAQLEGSVAAFRAALDETPRVRAPRRWALSQMNLGNALAALGDRDPSGTRLLDEAIAAYNLALEELPQEAEPLKWAKTQMNLGTTLIRLGERKDRRKHWLAAAAALVPALEVFEQQGAEGLADMTRRNLKRFHDSWDSFLAPPGTAASSAEKPAATPARPRLAQAG